MVPKLFKGLVTGGAGYLGTLLVPMLLEEGKQVVIFDRFMWGAQPILHFATHLDLEIVKADVRDRDALRSAMKKTSSSSRITVSPSGSIAFPRR